jgi:hypothetical protein
MESSLIVQNARRKDSKTTPAPALKQSIAETTRSNCSLSGKHTRPCFFVAGRNCDANPKNILEAR